MATSDRVRASIPATQWAIEELQPHDLRHVAEFLTGLLARAPLKTGANDPAGWAAERLILGCLASELRLIAHEAGETTFEPRTFGTDPLAKAREQVANLAAARTAADRDDARRRGDGEARMARVQARWDAEGRSA